MDIRRKIPTVFVISLDLTIKDENSEVIKPFGVPDANLLD